MRSTMRTSSLLVAALLLALAAAAPANEQALSSSTAASTTAADGDTSSTTTKKGILGVGKSVLGKAASTVSKAAGSAGRFVATHTTDEEICYNILGCFSLKSPWVSPLRPIPAPSSPDKIDVKLYLYTRKQPGRYNVTTFPEISLEGSDYQGSLPTFFIVHGFSSDGNATWLSDLKDALLEKVDANVFLVDWGNGANDGTYLQVAANTRIVGAEVGRVGRHLVDEHAADAKHFHFLGHSLGAQISSYAAKNITNVGRITAMDPAQPLFENLDKRVRIDTSDADFVDVIHSNAKPTIPFVGFGMMRPVGHVDFYLNGGADQPGCETPKLDTLKSIGDLAKIPINVIGNLVACSHGRSYLYMTEAIKSPCRMWGHKINLAQQLLNGELIPSSCRSLGSIGRLSIITTAGKCKPGECTPIGLDTPYYPTRGTFSVGTAPDKPYCVPENSDDGQQLNELRELGLLDSKDKDTPTTESTSRLKGLVSAITG
ncbi:Inactive pancreatic lipase-related protein 1 [Frankliniella fusca]|uniref:Inactive pancreatic lipase-related protein 1 n=1 Tax=Frankliniella fusca TaxID=407009 RepID=A0AAE1H5L8_9NEOP|nr:Inactive pancreatic lipase-related protein 1 [Frankliniella fusca]